MSVTDIWSACTHLPTSVPLSVYKNKEKDQPRVIVCSIVIDLFYKYNYSIVKLSEYQYTYD